MRDIIFKPKSSPTFSSAHRSCHTFLCFWPHLNTQTLFPPLSLLKMAATNGAVANGGPKPQKTVDISAKHPFPIHIDFSQFSFALFFIKLVVLLYDIITFPFYALYQQPWKHRAANRRVRARLQDPNDPYSAYVRVDKPFINHYVFKPETIPEFQQLSLKLNNRDQPALGTRDMISVTQEVQKNGKKLTKYNLGEYSWLTVGQADEKIGQLSRSFLQHGVKFQERVLIFAETRLGKCAQCSCN